MTKNIAALIGLALGSAVGGTVSFGTYGTLRDKGFNAWSAGAISGGVSALMAVALGMVVNKLDMAGLPKPTTMIILSTGLSQSAVGSLAPSVPRLGPVNVGAYVANPVGAYVANPVSGCAGCR